MDDSDRLPFWKCALAWGLAHFICYTLLDGLLYLMIHIPPRAVNIDSLILAVHFVFKILHFPRDLLRWLWPGETSFWLLNFATKAGVSVCWGMALAWIQERLGRA